MADGETSLPATALGSSNPTGPEPRSDRVERWLPLIVAPPFLLAAAAAVIYDVVRDIPPSYGCGDDKPLGQDAAVDAYQSGYEALHGITLVWLIVAILLLSWMRCHRAGEPRIGKPTLWVFIVLAVMTVMEAFAGSSEATTLLAITALLPAIALAFAAVPLGPQATGVVAAGFLCGAAIGIATMARADGPRYSLSTACWVLALLVAGHALVVVEQGQGPWLC